MNDIKDFLKQYKFKPNDLLGQNFMINDSVLETIVEAANLSKFDEVLEIGSGIGNLTKLLAERAKFVLAVEKDERYFPILRDQLGNHLRAHTRTPKSSANVELVFADIMRFHFQALLAPGYKVVANIPYYITGKIVEMLLTAKSKPSKIILLVQKEVAERIAAKPGEMSILAIAVQLYSQPKLVADVLKEDFFPQPEVDSAILQLDVRIKPLFDIDEKLFFKIVRSAFSGKRKQLRNTLKNNLRLPAEQLRAIKKRGNIDLSSRPQDLSLDQWYSLYDYLAKK